MWASQSGGVVLVMLVLQTEGDGKDRKQAEPSGVGCS